MPTKPQKRLLVSSADLAMLRGSGLNDATIRENDVRTENGATVFPYRDSAGVVNCFARRRLHTPIIDKDGKEIRYLQPPKSGQRAYFPVASLKAIQESDDAIITEGEKKALVLSQHGYAAFGLGGIWGGCKNSTSELIDDLAAMNWKGRVVYICFDYDEKPKTRRHVRDALRRLTKALRAAGASEVKNIDLPPGPNGEKMGVDDFIVANPPVLSV